MESPAHHLAPPTEPPLPDRSARDADSEPLDSLQSVLGHRFSDPDLLRQALTHSSLAHEKQDQHEIPASEHADNERLEFLGDAVVGMLTAEFLYRRYPELPEGDLTRLRAALVSRRHLGEVGRQLQLGRCLSLGRGEERSGGRSNAALLANATEALLGAIYLDAGIGTARRIVEQHVIEPSIEALRSHLQSAEGTGDYKSALQEWLQARKQGEPEYRVTAEAGPAHRRKFFVEVSAAGSLLGAGSGRSKKAAEQDAARQAIASLREAQ